MFGYRGTIGSDRIIAGPTDDFIDGNGSEDNPGLIRNDSGVAAIEFALLMPVLSFLLIGLWDLSLYADEKMRLGQLERSIASNVVANFDYNSFDNITTRIIGEFYSGENDPTPNVSVTSECRCDGISAGCYAMCSTGAPPDRVVSIFSNVQITAPLMGARLVESSLDVKIR